jgi:hypothetical protein
MLFAGGYVLQKLGWFPVLTYYPRLHQWSFVPNLDAEGPGMTWYGRLLGCTLLAGAGWLLGRVLEARLDAPKSLAVLDASAWATVFLAMAYTTYYELARWVL